MTAFAASARFRPTLCDARPALLHGMLAVHAAVAECARVGLRDNRGLGRAVAFVVPRPGALPAESESAAPRAELQRHLKGRTAEFKIPAEYRFVSALPRAATGQVQRFAQRG